MNTHALEQTHSEPDQDQIRGQRSSSGKPKRTFRKFAILALLVVAGTMAYYSIAGKSSTPPAAQPPSVTVSTPLQRDLETRLHFLGQFAAVEHVELRAQV